MTKRVLLWFFICSILISCKTKMEETPQNIHRKSMLVQFEDFSKGKLMEKECYLDLTFVKNASAKMGCNNLGFVYKLERNNIISFSQARSKRMFCEENEIETNFLNSVESFNSYKIEGHKLYLKTKLNI